MGKTFRNWEPDQRFLLPPAVDEFVPRGHSAHFVRDLVAEQLDLTAILDTYTEERGYPPYHPVIMTALSPIIHWQLTSHRTGLSTTWSGVLPATG